MISQHFSKIIALLFASLMGWYAYAYFLDTTTPVVNVSGINEQCYHCGEVQCCVTSDKSGVIALALDGQSLVHNFKIKAKQQPQSFAIPTKTLSNGKHVLKVDFSDST